jgi:arylsulfatase A
MKIPDRLLLAIVLLLVGNTAPMQSAPARQPNILLILADDLGHEAINSYGGTSYKTPSIDQLGKSGVRFTACYATPLCSPSRVELMTGRYGFRTSWINLIGRGQPEEVNDYFDPKKETTFGQVLKNAGYATSIAGKWQLCEFQKHPEHLQQCGFDTSLCWAWEIEGKQTSRYWAPVLWENGHMRKMPAQVYGEDLFSDFIIEFMKEHKQGPFFAYYPMALVHAPHIAPPGSPRAAGAQKAAAEGRRPRAGKKKRSTLGNEDDVVNDPANFPDMVAYMDKTVGKLMAALDELGLRENTLVIFTGDNGTDRRITSKMGNVSVPGGKGTVTELGSHVPLIASWPGRIAAGQVGTNLINFCDVLPTLAEIGGAQLAAGVKTDGRSFAPQLFGQAGQPREWVFTQLGQKRFARDHRFLLHSDGRLIDVPNDLFEKTDLSASDQPEVMAARKRLQAVLDRCK